MFAETIYYPLVHALRNRPDELAVSVKGKTCDNRHFAMLIAPIMNELDTFAEDTVAVLLEDEPITYAAVVACMLCGKTIVPISTEWPEDLRKQVQDEAQTKHLLSKESMFYYYWMTYEDSLCRIDSGFLAERDIPKAAVAYLPNEQGKLIPTPFSADDFFASYCAPFFKNIVKPR